MPEPLKSLSAAKSRNRSPHITALAWGRIEIEGVGAFRDAKVFPGGAREWDWNETGTAHEPGIQPADIAELLDHGATTIVLSQGMLKRLHVCPQALRLLAERRAAVTCTADRGGGRTVQPTARSPANCGIISHDLLIANPSGTHRGLAMAPDDQRREGFRSSLVA